MINLHAAGIDVGATFHVVAVPPERDERPVRTFRTFSGDLHQLADWLTATGITTGAMESTGVYWIPVFEILEARAFEVLLVNARDVKHVPDRKSDGVPHDMRHGEELGSVTEAPLPAQRAGGAWS